MVKMKDVVKYNLQFTSCYVVRTEHRNEIEAAKDSDWLLLLYANCLGNLEFTT